MHLASLLFGGNVKSSTEALSLSAVPENLAIVGGGYIGFELGTAYAKLGSKITLVETEKRILSQYRSRAYQTRIQTAERAETSITG